MPSIGIEEIKNSMLRSKDLFNNGVSITLDLISEELVNCYAYSLGIMYPRDIFNPGFSQNLKYYGREPEELMAKICIDLETLEKSFRRLDLNDKIILEENEYLIKVFYSPPNEKLKTGDFHFIRQDKQSGFWFHKWKKQQPKVIQPNLVPNLGPTAINSIWDDGFIFKYEATGYFAIKES